MSAEASPRNRGALPPHRGPRPSPYGALPPLGNTYRRPMIYQAAIFLYEVHGVEVFAIILLFIIEEGLPKHFASDLAAGLQ